MRRRDPIRVLLTLSAGALLALLCWQATRAQPARAQVALLAGDYVMLTAEAGSEDLCLVLDNRSETLLAYRVRNQNEVVLQARYRLPDLFRQAARQP